MVYSTGPRTAFVYLDRLGAVAVCQLSFGVMVNCAVFGCSNHTRKKPGDRNVAQVGFFSIPGRKENKR